MSHYQKIFFSICPFGMSLQAKREAKSEILGQMWANILHYFLSVKELQIDNGIVYILKFHEFSTFSNAQTKKFIVHFILFYFLIYPCIPWQKIE